MINPQFEPDDRHLGLDRLRRPRRLPRCRRRRVRVRDLPCCGRRRLHNGDERPRGGDERTCGVGRVPREQGRGVVRVEERERVGCAGERVGDERHRGTRRCGRRRRTRGCRCRSRARLSGPLGSRCRGSPAPSPIPRSTFLPLPPTLVCFPIPPVFALDARCCSAGQSQHASAMPMSKVERGKSSLARARSPSRSPLVVAHPRLSRARHLL